MTTVGAAVVTIHTPKRHRCTVGEMVIWFPQRRGCTVGQLAAGRRVERTLSVQYGLFSKWPIWRARARSATNAGWRWLLKLDSAEIDQRQDIDDSILAISIAASWDIRSGWSILCTAALSLIVSHLFCRITLRHWNVFDIYIKCWICVGSCFMALSVQIGYITPWSLQMYHLGTWDKQIIENNKNNTWNTIFNLVFMETVKIVAM